MKQSNNKGMIILLLYHSISICKFNNHKLHHNYAIIEFQSRKQILIINKKIVNCVAWHGQPKHMLESDCDKYLVHWEWITMGRGGGMRDGSQLFFWWKIFLSLGSWRAFECSHVEQWTSLVGSKLSLCELEETSKQTANKN